MAYGPIGVIPSLNVLRYISVRPGLANGTNLLNKGRKLVAIAGTTRMQT